jgi:LAO/AO transport system kinase
VASGHVVGITGPPGSGKSTLVAALARALRRAGQTVAVVATDPSSPFHGGALLGDRVRMASLQGDPGVFVRSVASRGAGGALAGQAGAMTAILSRVGFDVVLLETVGAGQDELAVAGEAQTVVVVSAPGAGDEIQALKAGILEIGDVLVVNKADQAGTDRLMVGLRFGRGLMPQVEAPGAEGESWTPPVLQSVATEERGIDELVTALQGHRDWLRAGGLAGPRRRALAEAQILRRAAARCLAQATARSRRREDWSDLVEAVAAGRLSAAGAAALVLGQAEVEAS